MMLLKFLAWANESLVVQFFEREINERGTDLSISSFRYSHLIKYDTFFLRKKFVTSLDYTENL